VEKMLSASAIHEGGLLAGVIGVLLLIVGATSVFGQLQDSLNAVWKVRRKPGKTIMTLVRQRILSFAMILVIAFLMLVSLILTAALSAIGTYAQSRLPGGAELWQWVNTIVSFGVITVLFGALYKILPDVKLGWRDVRLGGFATALLFTLGKFLIGLYLGKSGVASTYGAAGAGVFILLWAYYSSAILLYGAEYTRAHALLRGGEIHLKEGAEWDPTTIGNPSKNPDFAKAVQA
jgi:membrane protein